MVPNPAYRRWIAQDQAILGAIQSSLTPSVAGMVVFAATSRDAWATLDSSFSSQSLARSSAIRNQLGEVKKHNLYITAYFNKVKSLADTLSSIGKPLRDEEFTSFILNGLDEDYDSLIENINGRDTPMPPRDLYARLLNTEQRLATRRSVGVYTEGPSANAALRGGARGAKKKRRRPRGTNLVHPLPLRHLRRLAASGYTARPVVVGLSVSFAALRDIDECKKPELYPCFGKCTNKDGSFECTCSKGHEGNASKKHGCVMSINTGLIIGLSVSSGPTILILLVTTKIIIRKLKNQKEQKLRQKFFNQNRGQLLQKLVSHRSDIAERMIIPLRELEKATNKFHPTRKLGGGGHGTVYKGILSDLHVVAIKKSNIVVKSEINEFINEVSILSQINHRNIVKLLGCCLETEVPLLAYEFISNGTLCDYLHKKPLRSLPWQEILRIASEIGKALSYLHSGLSVPIIHRDIKSTNILLDDALTVKVCDFGASRYIPRDKATITIAVQGTLGYLDPTYFYCGRLTEKSDVYSFGVILIELLTRKMPIIHRSSSGDGLVAQFVELIAKGKLVDILDPQVMEEGGSQVDVVASLAMSCTKLRAEERPTMRSVEMTLEALQGPKERFRVQDATYERSYSATRYTSPRRRTSLEETSRQYSQEEEFVLSASYPR
ncbi:putative wall-associated receptor kinase-like 16 [Triticum urartu]|uniref:putative wall-associated receptor kinase-like 16 n=1 Tax=Triticum urartu TaxID=4572 RepID=UPI0020441ED0|nr:putative wall-associated receptor kinase-like 16 [Triticum urartu]